MLSTGTAGCLRQALFGSSRQRSVQGGEVGAGKGFCDSEDRPGIGKVEWAVSTTNAGSDDYNKGDRDKDMSQGAGIYGLSVGVCGDGFGAERPAPSDGCREVAAGGYCSAHRCGGCT